MSRIGLNKARLGMILGGLCVLGVCAVVRSWWGAAPARAQSRSPAPAVAAASPAVAPAAAAAHGASAPSPASSDATAGKKPLPAIVATVNGRPLSREELAQECILHHGKEVLETMTNKYLILQECRRRQISITREEVDAEINRMAKRFNIPVDQWMKLLKQERGIEPEQYASDIVWPTLALRKLAGERMAVTRAELTELFESEYGPAVQVRMIALRSREKAREVQAQAAAHPEEFDNLAKTYSEDAPSACLKGLIQPIHMHSGCREVEEAAFALADGAVSPVIAASGSHVGAASGSQVIAASTQFVILKREGLIAARKVRLEDVADRLEESIRDRKLRTVAADTFAQLQKPGAVENVLNDPVKSRQMPGVAALINGQPIKLQQLGDECTDRYGQEVLEGMINRTLLELACKQNHVVVSQQEIDAEIARAAAEVVKLLPDGSPDVKTWLELVAKRQGISVEIYRRDCVWPSVALEKLAACKLEVSAEDIQRGFEANYGSRVRCRAIVLANLRRAQQVWEMARKQPTLEAFGELAAKYSIEGTSRALQGEVPPIRRYGGQPLLEQEAFTLKPGELSGVIQLEDEKYVILFCEGYTPAMVDVKLTDGRVRSEIEQDVRQKKQRLAMAKYFEQLQDAAAVDNYLTGTSKSPVKTAGGVGDSKRVAPAVYNTPAGK